MLESILWILLTGFFSGQLASRLKAPPLVGMVVVGILLGPQLGNRLSADILSAADSLRTLAVMVILMKAGLGLDREKLAQQGSVALRLGFLPGACEAAAVAIASMWLLGFDLATGLLLGCIIGAESPAVIVPGMLRLKRLGWGVGKGISDAILTGSALSDVLLLLVFSLLLSFLTQGSTVGLRLPGGGVLTPLQLLPFQVVVQIGLGVLLGWLTARLLAGVVGQRAWTQNIIQDTLVAAGVALWLVVLSRQVPIFSGYLAVMAAGFFLVAQAPPLARRLRVGFNGLWTVAEIFLFVLLGASIQLQVLESTLWVGLLLLVIGVLLGRSLGWYLSTLGSNWTAKEKLFLLPGNSAKATVQAAIGAIPLAQGIEGGEAILAISALSILVTAPLGAWAIPTFAPRLLARGEVDPTKVAIARRVTILAVIESSATAAIALTKAAELARQSDGEVVVLPVASPFRVLVPQCLYKMQHQTQRILADIDHQLVLTNGVSSLLPAAAICDEIMTVATQYQVTEIIAAKVSAGDVSAESDPAESSGSRASWLVQSLIAVSTIPVVIVAS